MQSFTTAQTMKEDGMTVIPQQVPSMIPIPSVTLRTLVLDLLGKSTFVRDISIDWLQIRAHKILNHPLKVVPHFILG